MGLSMFPTWGWTGNVKVGVSQSTWGFACEIGLAVASVPAVTGNA